MARANPKSTLGVLCSVALIVACGGRQSVAEDGVLVVAADRQGTASVGYLKWSQPPIEFDPESKTPMYCGWDEPSSVTRTTDGLRSWKLVADDFRCFGTMPVASVHWWGSYGGWDGAAPPQRKPTAWRIGFWSNVPANPQGKITYSYPNALLWQIEVPAARVQENWVGADLFPGKSSESCFAYYVKLEPTEYFRQQDYSSATRDNVFWISIVAVYSDDSLQVWQVWGWKTRPQHWMDDAVTVAVSGDIKAGYTNTSVSVITPIENRLICQQLQSYDMAFELDTDPNYVKWEQAYTGIRQWLHYEDEESMATEDAAGKLTIRRMVADDWKCRGKTPVTAIVWWGSYIGYKYRPCECEQLPRPVRPAYFLLSIWTDAPDPNVNNPKDYSHPGDKIWEYQAYDYDEVLVGYDKHPEGAAGGTSHEPVFRYSVGLPKDKCKWFCQQNVEGVYWLSIMAVYKNTQAVAYPWGWTNHKCTTWGPEGLHEALYWKMDDTTGTVATDDSGNGNHGTLRGDASWEVCCGRTCGALKLDGAGDYAKVDSPVGLDFAPGSFTTSAWTRANKVADGWRTIMEYDRDGSDFNRFGMWVSGAGKFHFRVGLSTADSAEVLNSDTWYLLTGVYDATTKKMNLYINGHLDSEAALTQGYKTPHAAKLTVGVRGSEDGEYFDGLIDDVRIYNYALTGEQVKSLFEAARNDDAVASNGNPTGGADLSWPWESLHDQVGMSEDMSFVLFTEPGCYPCCMSDYYEWLSVGKPACWCYPRQCHGDHDGKSQGSSKTGYYYVGTADLNTLIMAWMVKEPPMGPGIASIPKGICADFAHDIQGSTKSGLVRVGTNDLNILIANWLVKEPAMGPGVKADCLECPGGQVTSRPLCATQCPAVETQCPAVETKCWPVATRCPVVDTQCPVVGTKCPPVPTKCPAVATGCPVVDTQCPVTDTKCPPATTRCPVVETQCPGTDTKCPVTDTKCPPAASRCPVVDTQCPPVESKCTLQETVCPAVETKCPVADTKCPVTDTKCPVTDTRCPPAASRCPVVDTQCPPVESKCTLRDTVCPPVETKCPAVATGCPVVETQCPATDTKCPMTETKCPVTDTKCPVTDTKCPPAQTQCPPVDTRCPAVQTKCQPTYCPTVQTQCPATDTRCPLADTQCPAIDTQCPPVDTRCPALQTKCQPTLCPVVQTQCPALQTECPPVDTQCPRAQTKCPPVNTQCPADPTKCQPTVCPVVQTQCPMIQTQCAGPATQCPPVQTQCPVIGTLCPTITTQCPRCYAADVPARAQFLLATTSCPAIEAACPSLIAGP